MPSGVSLSWSCEKSQGEEAKPPTSQTDFTIPPERVTWFLMELTAASMEGSNNSATSSLHVNRISESQEQISPGLTRSTSTFRRESRRYDPYPEGCRKGGTELRLYCGTTSWSFHRIVWRYGPALRGYCIGPSLGVSVPRISWLCG